MWSKGAVVIVKRGDEAMADAIEKGLDLIPYKPNDINLQEVEDLKRDNYFLRKKSKEATDKMIADARELYGYNWTPPRWANKIVEGFAFIVYLFSMFVDKFLIIKE